MTIKAPFNPSYTSGQVVAPAAAAASINLPQSKQICLTNLGASVCYVRIGPPGIAATTADYPVMPGLQLIVTKQESDTVLSHISAAGTSLHVMAGEGF